MQSKRLPTTKTRKHPAKILLLSSLLCFSLLGLLFAYESYQSDQIYTQFKKDLRKTNQAFSHKLTDEFGEFTKTIDILSQLPSILNLLDYSELHNLDTRTIELDNYASTITTGFKAVLHREQHVLSAQLILEDGRELMKLERDRQYWQRSTNTQPKSKLLYDLFKLGEVRAKDDTFIAPLFFSDQPEKNLSTQLNTIRLIKTLKRANKKTVAVLVLDVDISALLQNLNTDSLLNSSTANYLIDHNGFYLTKPKTLQNEESNWFQDTNNAIPLSAESEIQTLFLGEPHLFTSQELSIFSDTPESHYYLFTGLPIATIQDQIRDQRREFLSTLFISFILIITITSLSRKHIRKLETLFKQQFRYKVILENSSDAIISIKQSGEIIDANQAAEILFGFNSETEQTLNFFDLVISESNEILNEAFILKLINQRHHGRLEVIPNNQHKNNRRLLITFCPMDTKNDEENAIALIIRDITHQRANQKKLEDMNAILDAKVKKRTEELEAQKQKALKANQTKSRFVANISHEIRTPLNGINGLLALARDPKNADKQDEYLALAQDSAESLNILINDLLDFSKIESGKLELNLKRFNLKTLLEQSLQTASFLLKDKPIELILDLSAMKISWVFLDENRIKQILSNLLSNAIKFTSEGQIILSCATNLNPQDQNQLICQIKVSDSGMGITKEQQSRLFKPFSQGNAGIAHQFGGTGLGLSITKQLCELMQGNLTLESESGQGSTFKAVIPSEVVKTKLSVTDDAPLCLDKHSVWLCIRNDHLRRTLRNQLHSWQVNVHLIHHLEQIIRHQPETAFNAIILDADFFSKDLHQVLSDKGFKLIYLNTTHNDQLKQLTPYILRKPVLPSKLAATLQQTKLTTPSQNVTTANQDHDPKPIKSLRLSEKMENKKETSVGSEKTEQHVVIVDDNEINRIVGKGLLSTMKVSILTAENGQDAIERLQKLPWSSHLPVILMDCQMPIMDGYTATRLIREGKSGTWLKHAPIIAMTADAMTENREECKAAGMDDFIGKPFNSDELRTIISKWTSQRSPLSTPEA